MRQLSLIVFFLLIGLLFHTVGSAQEKSVSKVRRLTKPPTETRVADTRAGDERRADSAEPTVPSPSDHTTAMSSPSMTPEMWLYMEEVRRQSDPKFKMARAAEFKAWQRRYRLASQQWYGNPVARPQANPNPFSATYSPAWAGTDWNEYLWLGGRPSTTQHVRFDTVLWRR